MEPEDQKTLVLEDIQEMVEEIEHSTEKVEKISMELMDFTDDELLSICEQLDIKSLGVLRVVNSRFGRLCRYRPLQTRMERAAYLEAKKWIQEARKNKDPVLDLSFMGLKQVPPEIGKLTWLMSLSLNDNQLTELPPEIGNLTGLSVLYLENNQLTTLPIELLQIPAMDGVFVAGNLFTLQDLPPEFQDPHVHLDFLTEEEREEERLKSMERFKAWLAESWKRYE